MAKRDVNEWLAQDAARGTRRASNPHPAIADAERNAAAFRALAAKGPHTFQVPASRGRWVVLVHRDTGSEAFPEGALQSVRGWQATTFEDGEPIMDRRSVTWRGLLGSMRRDPIDWTKAQRPRVD